MKLTIEHLKAGYDSVVIIDDLSLAIPEGKITALIGANGCGKSTLLKTICRIQPRLGGCVLLDGEDVHEADPRALAKSIAILPQNPTAPEGLTVRELVSYGRAPYKTSFFSRTTAKDSEMIDWALTETNMMEFQHRPIGAMSGGQRQRAWIAMAIAQDTEILFLDEPTSFLDVAHQMEVLRLVQHLNEAYGKTIVMVLHELNQAARFAHCLVGMCRGQLLYCGTPKEVFHKEMLHRVFHIDAELMSDPRTGKPMCIPYCVNESEHSV